MEHIDDTDIPYLTVRMTIYNNIYVNNIFTLQSIKGEKCQRFVSTLKERTYTPEKEYPIKGVMGNMQRLFRSVLG